MPSEKESPAASWISRADNDLQYAVAGEKETGQHHITCFLCQQAAEKILKGLLVHAGNTVERTHHLGRLASQASVHYPHLKDQIADIRKLDKYYITTRYPDDLRTDFSKEDAAEALQIAQALLEWVYSNRIFK